ncbi:YdcF family protein [Leptolyngbyaceae cyanobacterium UHCC 1019]
MRLKPHPRVQGAFPLAQRSPRKKRHRFKKQLFWLLILLLVLWVSYREINNYFVEPQAIFVLGGATGRENFAAEFARQHPKLPVWVSGGSNPEYTYGVFSDAGINLNQLHINREAVDTVTNFTTLVDELKAKGIHSVYLITSDYHMRRAKAIGEIVFGSRGIYMRPIAVRSNQAAEPWQKAVRDGGRAVLWVTTGYSGSTLKQQFSPN